MESARVKSPLNFTVKEEEGYALPGEEWIKSISVRNFNKSNILSLYHNFLLKIK